MEKEKSCLSWSELGFSQTAPWPLLLKTYTATVLKDITRLYSVKTDIFKNAFFGIFSLEMTSLGLI